MESDTFSLLKPLPNLAVSPKAWFRDLNGYEVLLHSDPYSKARYLKRGFVYLCEEHDKQKLTEPEILEKKLETIVKDETKSPYFCCGKDWENSTAYGCHRRKRKHF